MFTRLLQIAPTAKNSFFLFGARGTGKTAWVREHFPEAVYVDLLDTSLQMKLAAQPNRLEQLIPKRYQGWIVIDEIQKIPELLDEVHRLIESKRLRFVLTGSSARKLRKQGVNLLAGRAHTYHMYPLTTQEIGNFNLEEILRFGTLPGLWGTDDRKRFLQSYVNTYVREEVLQEGLTRNLGAFHRFLEAASLSQGSLLNVSNIARETMVSRKIVENYFSILEDLLLGFYLPPFTKRAKRQINTHPKFYFLDVGVFQILRPRGPLDIDSEIAGAALETLLIQEVRALNDYLQWGYQLSFWQTVTKYEVDLVLYGEKGFFAFEVKHTRKINKQDLRGLKAFSTEFPEAHCYLFYLGEQVEYVENITIMPFATGLVKLVGILGKDLK